MDVRSHGRILSKVNINPMMFPRTSNDDVPKLFDEFYLCMSHTSFAYTCTSRYIHMRSYPLFQTTLTLGFPKERERRFRLWQHLAVLLLLAVVCVPFFPRYNTIIAPFARRGVHPLLVRPLA